MLNTNVIATQQGISPFPYMIPGLQHQMMYQPVPQYVPSTATSTFPRKVTDQTGCEVESFLITTLRQNVRDRPTIYSFEKDMREFCLNPTLIGIRFPKMTSYHRMLVHRMATYYGLDHNVDESGRQVICHKGPNTRIPQWKLDELIKMQDEREHVSGIIRSGSNNDSGNSSSAKNNHSPREDYGFKKNNGQSPSNTPRFENRRSYGRQFSGQDQRQSFNSHSSREKNSSDQKTPRNVFQKPPNVQQPVYGSPNFLQSMPIQQENQYFVPHVQVNPNQILQTNQIYSQNLMQVNNVVLPNDDGTNTVEIQPVDAVKAMVNGISSRTSPQSTFSESQVPIDASAMQQQVASAAVSSGCMSNTQFYQGQNLQYGYPGFITRQAYNYDPNIQYSMGQMMPHLPLLEQPIYDVTSDQKLYYEVKFHHGISMKKIEAEIVLNFLRQNHEANLHFIDLGQNLDNTTAIENFRILVDIPMRNSLNLETDLASKQWNFELLDISETEALNSINEKENGKYEVEQVAGQLNSVAIK